MTREWSKGFGEQTNAIGKNGDFASARLTNDTISLDKVACIEKLELLDAKLTFFDIVGGLHKDLDFTEIISNFNKSDFTKGAYGYNTTRHTDLLTIFFIKMVENSGDFGISI